ncbi:hypothetical protein Tco_1434314, partial [Tanacetum coccineum]
GHTVTRPNHHDPNAQDMKPWKRYCFHNFTTSFYYGKDVIEMKSLEIDDMLRIRVSEAESDEEIVTSVAWIRDLNINEPIYAKLCHEFYSTYEFDEVCADDELQTKKIIKFRLGGRAHSLTLLEFARSREDNLGLSRSHTSTIRRPILRVIHKMITYGLCQRKTRVLTEDVVRSLSAPIYCRDMDTTTLRDLTNSNGKLIPEDPQPGVPRVGIPRPPRASIYHGVFEYMAGVYSVPMQGAYNPPGYAQPQYDQYYQQFPPPPPQQQQDDHK